MEVLYLRMLVRYREWADKLPFDAVAAPRPASSLRVMFRWLRGKSDILGADSDGESRYWQSGRRPGYLHDKVAAPVGSKMF